MRLVLGGALLGIAIGALASRVHLELDDHLVEITLTTVVAFGAYLGAEALHLSGVVAVVAAGLTIGNFGQATMSPSTRLAVTAFWEYAGFVVNSLVFLLVGIEVAYVNWTDKIGVALVAALVVLAGRAAIYPLTVLVNRVGGEVPSAWRHILFWGGLRGALSMALVLGLPANFPQRETLVAATFGVVLFSLLVQGLSIGALLQRLGLTGPRLRSPRGNQRLASEIVATRAALAHLDQMRISETYPAWIVETLAHDYERRLALLEPESESSQPQDGLTEEKQAAEVRSLILVAEKSSYQDAERQGLLDEDDWRNIAARIDAELLALKLKLMAP